MSLRSDALTIKNETTSGANTATRIGGLFENISKVTETVDTIADLRDFDTTQLQDGDMIRVLGHTQKGIGGGVFEWKTTPVLTLNNGTDVVGSLSSDGSNRTVTPTTRGLMSATQQGSRLRFANDAKAMVVRHDAVNVYNTEKHFGKGSTEVRMVIAQDVPDGTSAYMDDDNGVFIIPNETPITGYYERVFDGIVDPMMYGAIPNETPYDGAVNDSADAMQKFASSLFSGVIRGGHFYISKPVILDVNKRIDSAGMSYMSNGDSRRKRNRVTGRGRGVVYCVNDHDLFIQKTPGEFTFILSTESAPDHRSAGVRVDMSYLVNTDLKVEFTGNMDTFKTTDDHGSTAVYIDDFLPAKDAQGVYTNDDFDLEQETFDIYASGTGSMAMSKVYVNAMYLHTMVYASPSNPDKDIGTWSNTVWYDIYGVHYKKGANILNNDGNGRLTGQLQSSFVFNSAQPLTKAANTISGGGFFYDIWIHDLGISGNSNEEQNGYYKHVMSCEFLSGDIMLGAQAIKDGRFINGALLQNYHGKGIQNAEFSIPKRTDGGGDRTAISRLLNGLSFMELRGYPVSATAYQALASYDYESNLQVTSELTEDSNVAITNLSRLFSHSPNPSRMEIEFQTGASEDSFVELVVGDPTGDVIGSDGVFQITLDPYEEAYFKKIQVFTPNGGSDIKDIIPTSGARTYSFNIDRTNFPQFVVRFIGCTEVGVNKPVGIDDIFSKYQTSTGSFLPYVNKEGSQRIYGSLTANEFNTVPYNNNSAQLENRAEPLKVIYRKISVAELASLFDTPITLLDIEALDRVVHVERLAWAVDSGDTDWTTNTVIEVTNNEGIAGTINLGNLPQNSGQRMMQTTTDQTALIKTNSRTLSVQAPTANPAGGDKDLMLWVYYREFSGSF